MSSPLSPDAGHVVITDGANNARVLTAAPGSDTGQAALAVRVVSQLGGGSSTVNQGTGGVSAWLVSGPLTDTQLRATAVPVSGPLTDTQIRATALPVSGPLTDTQLRATAVPVSGPLTDTQIRATALPVSGTVTANAGTGNFGTNLAQVGGASVALGQAASSASLPVVSPSDSPLPTSGGCSISRTLSANNTTGIVVKNAAGQLYALICTNTNASPRYAKLYNKATAPTVGSDTPVMTLVVPGNTVGAGVVIPLEMGVAFATGIGLGISTGIADADTGAPAVNEVVVHALYK